MPEHQSRFEFKNFKFEDSLDRKLADFCDLLSDSVDEYFKAFQESLFNELLANKIADTIYPVSDYDEEIVCSNLMAKNYYYNNIRNKAPR